MSNLIAEYRIEDNLCTLLGFNSDKVKTIHLYASKKGTLFYKVTGNVWSTDKTEEVEVQSWYQVNCILNQYLPLNKEEAQVKDLNYQPLGQIYPYIGGLNESAQYK